MSTFARNHPSNHNRMAAMASAASRSSSSTSSSSSSSSSSSAAAAAADSSSARSTTATSSDLKSNQDVTFNQQKYLTNCKSLYSCIHCRTHLANHDELVSRSFQGNHGRAYLFNSVINICCGPAVQRHLNTGTHSVADISCSNCEILLGWKYEKAFVESQKYKEGKYIIELAQVVRENRHLELDRGEIFMSRQMSGGKYRYNQKCNKNNSNNNNNNISMKSANDMSSLIYSSSSRMSSPTDSAFGGDYDDDDNDYSLDDDELMFPFYDDLCASRSSYPGNLSMSHHDRARRSLYLESKPYDWKNNSTNIQPTSSSSSSTSSPRLRSTTTATTTDSAISSDDLTSPSSSAADCCHVDNHDDDDDDDDDNEEHDDHDEQDVCKRKIKANKRPKRDDEYGDKCNNNNEDNIQDDSETQFKLENDLPHVLDQAGPDRRRTTMANQCIPDGAAEASTSNDLSRSSDEIVENNTNQSTSSSSSSSPSPLSGKQTINLDDEEFYDCYSEHDVMNSLNWPDNPEQPHAR